MEDAQKIKDIESITNHDVKAVEYFLKEKLKELNCEDLQEWIHFGLTSQDINNTAIPLLWKDAIEFEYLPAVINLQHELLNLVQKVERYSHACQNSRATCISNNVSEKKSWYLLKE